jgi:hypothetical protein
MFLQSKSSMVSCLKGMGWAASKVKHLMVLHAGMDAINTSSVGH